MVAEIQNVPDSEIADESTLKSIESIVLPEPVFTRAMIEYILGYARIHCIHIHKVASFFMSAPVRKRLEKYGLENGIRSSRTIDIFEGTLFYKKHLSEVVDQVVGFLQQKNTVVIVPNERYIDLVLQQLANKE